MTDNGTGWELDKRTHFDEIVVNYDRIRPMYPSKMIEDIFSYTGTGNNENALEIGAGTGKATKPFLDAGYNVTAVEAGSHMAEFLRVKFNANKNFRVIVSSFEDVALENESFDLIYAASAFHWVDAEIGCPKAFQLLRKGGAIALLRYNFNIIPPDGEVLSEEIQSAYGRHYYSYYSYETIYKPERITVERLTENPKILSGYGFKDLGEYGFGDISMNLYDASQVYSADEWIGLLDTLSDHRNLPEDNRLSLYAEVKDAIQNHGGQHKIDFVFQLYMGRKRQ